MSGGIRSDNKTIRRTESFLTPETLKRRFLYGVEITDDNGQPLPEESYQDYIDIATSMLETALDICIAKRVFKGAPVDPDTGEVNDNAGEEKDFQSNDYWQWGYFQLNNLPVIKVTEIRAVYPSSTILKYPPEWFKLQRHDGVLRLIPTSGTIVNFQVDNGGHYFPEIFRHQGHVPLVWQIDYEAGFDDGKIPMDINAAIGMIAAIFALDIAGDLVVGAGIASSSLSIDSLSQSINTTSSAENHAYSAKVKEYQRLLFGESINSPDRGLIRNLRDFWQGSTINIL